jgi:nicotinic acid mononucleotide adenylyltransferase
MASWSKIIGLLSILLAFEAWAQGLDEQSIKSAHRVGVMIGAFDHVTKAHLELASQAAKEASLDYVIVLPNPKPFLKIPSPLTQRLKMIDLAASQSELIRYPKDGDLFETFVASGDYGAWARYLKKLNPDLKIYAVVGQDLAEKPTTATRVQLKLNPDGWIVGSRSDKPMKLKALVHRSVQYIQVDGAGISSTLVRKYFQSKPQLYLDPEAPNELVNKGILNPQVAKHISGNGLYLEAHSALSISKRIADTRRKILRKILGVLGLGKSWRDRLAASRARPDIQSVKLGDQEYPVRKYLGGGLRSNAYLVQIAGEDVVVKIPNSAVGSFQQFENSLRIHQWLESKSGIHVPKMMMHDLSEGWEVSEFIHGLTIDQYLSTYGKPSPILEKRLRTLISEANIFQAQTGTKLDLFAHNIIIREDVPYLIDHGPINRTYTIPSNYDEALMFWKTGTTSNWKDCLMQRISRALEVN